MVVVQKQDHQEVSSGITVQAREDMGDLLAVVDTRIGIPSGRGISLRKHNDTYCPQSVRCYFPSRTPWNLSCFFAFFFW